MDDKTAEAMSTLRNSPDLADVEAGELLAARIAELESQLLSAQQELTVCKRTNKWLPNMTAQDGLLKNERGGQCFLSQA